MSTTRGGNRFQQKQEKSPVRARRCKTRTVSVFLNLKGKKVLTRALPAVHRLGTFKSRSHSGEWKKEAQAKAAGQDETEFAAKGEENKTLDSFI